MRRSLRRCTDNPLGSVTIVLSALSAACVTSCLCHILDRRCCCHVNVRTQTAMTDTTLHTTGWARGRQSEQAYVVWWET